MEKKILHTFRLINSLFSEARFVYDEPKGPAGAEAGKVEKKEEKAEEKTGKKEKVEKGSKKERAKEKAGIEGRKEREKFKEKEKLPANAGEKKEEEVKLPSAPSLKFEEFLKKDIAEKTGELDWFKINGTREETKINAQTWDHSTTEGLQKMYKDFRALGIMSDNKDKAYYDTMFAILNGAASASNPYLAENNGNYRPMFKSPTDGASRDTIAGLNKKGSFAGGESYLRAFDALTFVKARLMVQDKKQVDTLTAQGKKGVDPIGAATVDFVKSNISVLQKAAQDRDYATLGIYAVGAYALWKTLGSKLFGDDHGHGGGDHGGHGGINWKNWALIGAAVYGADKLLKNAGYDVLKMAGFKGMDAEVKGTPLESMKGILAQSQYSEEMKDFDYGIALTMSESKLSDLNKMMLDANKSGLHFIHPREFPALFPDLKDSWPFKMGQGEGSLKDYVGMSNTKLGGKEREYIRVGQQLYKLALALPVIYEKTLYKDHEKYKGLSYDKMLADPSRGNLKVRHLMEAVSQYAPETAAGGLFSSKKPQEIEEKLRNGTGKVLGDAGFTLDTAELQPGSGHFAGQLKGFPVVIVAVKEGYRVYLQNDYNDKKAYNSAPGTKFTLIPAEGSGMERAAKDATAKVDARMKELMKKLKDENRTIGDLKYESGQWKTVTEFKGAADLGVDPSKVPTLITVDELGKTIRLDNGEPTADRYLERVVLGRLLDQGEFHALRYFGAVKRLGINKTPGTNDGVCTLLIGKNKNISAEIKYVNGRFEFKNPADEKTMLASSGFKEEFRDALSEDEKLNEVTKNWEKSISAAPSDYLKNFVRHIPDIFTRATLDNPFRGLSLDMIDGSVAKKYALNLIEAQKSLILAKVAAGIDGAQSLADVSKKVGQLYTPEIDKLNAVSNDFNRLVVQHEKDGKNVTEQEFNEAVISKIGEIGIESSDYKTWYAEFTNELFLHYGVNNLRPGNAKKAGDVAKVFAYYTAVLDDKSIDGANLSLTVTKESEDYIQRIKNARVAWARTKPNPTDLEVASEVNHQLTISNPLGLPYLAEKDIAKFDAVSKEIDKSLKYKTYAKYKKVVADQIFSKLNDVDEKVVVPTPENHGFWQIPDFKTWAATNTVKLHESVDTNERIKMNRDYITLDVYFKMSDAERAANKKNVILPRENARFEIRIQSGRPIPQDADKAELINKLLESKGNSKDIITPEVFEYTEAETIFRQKINKVLDKIDKEYGKRGKDILKDRFGELKDMFNYSARFKRYVNLDKSKNGVLIYDYSFDKTVIRNASTGRITSEWDKQLADEIKSFDAKFSTSSPETITKGDQENYMNKQVENFINKVLLSEHGKLTYFKEEKGLLEKVGNALKQIGKDIKEWLI